MQQNSYRTFQLQRSSSAIIVHIVYFCLILLLPVHTVTSLHFPSLPRPLLADPAVKVVTGKLGMVEALRDLRTELQSLRDGLYQELVEEIHKHLYSRPKPKPKKKEGEWKRGCSGGG